MSMFLSVFWFWRYSMIKFVFSYGTIENRNDLLGWKMQLFLKTPDILTKFGKPKIRTIIKAKNILISSMFYTFEH